MKSFVTKTNLTDLNPKQLKAVVSEEKRLLVLAGAGSGKTKTLIQKLEYLIKDKGAKTSEILAITFTKNAANEMIDRLLISSDNTGEYEQLFHTKRRKKEVEFDRRRFLKNSWVGNVTIKTFHSQCFGMLKNYGSKGTLNNFNDNKFRLLMDSGSSEESPSASTAEETRSEVLGKMLIEKCKDKHFLIEFKKYLLDYLVDRIDHKKSSQNTQYPTTYTTLNGTKVRSKSEQYIADWLYRHNIKFVYEPIVNMKRFDFKPDFFLPEGNIYIEHVSNLSGSIENKARELREAGKTVLYTYEDQTKDTAYFNAELEKAIKGRMPLDHIFDSDLNYEEEFKYYHKEINDFRRQVLSVMDMLKIENIERGEVLNKAKASAHERVRIFYKFAGPLIEDYTAYCVNKSYQDFNDLILSTVDLLRNNNEIRESIRSQYKYILVDEFQDVNNLQVELLSLMLTEETQLFCVGDDWQSIYGFRGSNVDYIVNFKKHYPGANAIKLNLNYRSTKNIVSASNEVIKKNKIRVDKHVEAFKLSNSAIHVFKGTNEDENIGYATKQVEKLIEQGYDREDILFLYRRSKMYKPYFEAFKKSGIFVTNKTIHSAKGLEAKAVFVIGLTEGNGGFPDIWISDVIYQVVKETQHDVLMEEERRLFYVAITRAKDHLFLLSKKDNPSRFIDEIPREFKLDPKIELTGFKIFQCHSCRTKVQSTDNFCSYCGTSLGSAPNENLSDIAEANSFNLMKEEAQKKHSNAYEPWTESKDQELEKLFCEGVNVKELMKHFGRSKHAIISRIEKLKLKEKYDRN